MSALVDINFFEVVWEVIKSAVVWGYVLLMVLIKTYWSVIKPLLIIIALSCVVIIFVILFERPWVKRIK